MKIILLFGFVLGALPAAAKHFFGQVTEKVTLECGISPNPTNPEWFHNEKLVLKVIRNGFISRASNTDEAKQKYNLRGSNLEISNLKKEDAGKFTCKENKESQEHWLHLVSVDVKPSNDLLEGSEALVQCELHSSDQRITVRWQKPDGSTFNEKRVNLKPVKASHGGTWTCEVEAAEESFKASLTIKVTSSGPKTTKTPLITSTEENNTCVICPPGRGGQQPGIPLLLGLHWWVWVALGASCLILILLIISTVIMSQRARRRKRRFQMMKKAQQQQRPKKYCQCQSRQPAAKPAGKPSRKGRREKPSPLPLQPLLTE